MGHGALRAGVVLPVCRAAAHRGGEPAAPSDGIYRELQEANGLPEAAGVTQEEMERLDGMLADYLAGDEAALDGSPFNEKELAHMRDVLGLFDLARTARLAACPSCAAALLAAGLWLSRGARLLCRCASRGWRRCFCRWGPSPSGRRRIFPVRFHLLS